MAFNNYPNYSDSEPEQSEKISLYNSGMAQIKRLDELWTKIHKYAEAGLLTKWNWGLDRIWCELVGDIPEEVDDNIAEEEDIEEGGMELETKKPIELSPIKRFQNFNLEIGHINKKFIDKQLNSMDYQRTLYQTLMDKEAFLHRLQNKLGKGTKLVDADEDDFE